MTKSFRFQTKNYISSATQGVTLICTGMLHSGKVSACSKSVEILEQVDR